MLRGAFNARFVDYNKVVSSARKHDNDRSICIESRIVQYTNSFFACAGAPFLLRDERLSVLTGLCIDKACEGIIPPRHRHRSAATCVSYIIAKI